MVGVRSYLELNEAMALRALLDQVLAVESCWEDETARRQGLQTLRELLEAGLLHRGPKLQALAHLANKLPQDPSFQQFLAIFVPIERQHGRLVEDADFLVRSEDNPPSQAAGKPLPVSIILDNIRSVFNVGSILRLTEGLGFREVYLCGYTARPDQDKVARAALGAVVAWQWHAHARDVVLRLKEAGQAVFALETSDQAVCLEDFRFPERSLALLFGNERYGLEPELLRLCDGTIEIPCRGLKNSLNVAVAAGIVGFELRRQWLNSGFGRHP